MAYLDSVDWFDVLWFPIMIATTILPSILIYYGLRKFVKNNAMKTRLMIIGGMIGVVFGLYGSVIFWNLEDHGTVNLGLIFLPFTLLFTIISSFIAFKGVQSIRKFS